MLRLGAQGAAWQSPENARA